MKKAFSYILLLFVSFPRAQDTFSGTLDTVYLRDIKKSFLPVDSVYIIDDSLYHTATSLNEILFLQAALPLREYGRGMVSGISVRGSSPAHVQVLWHGMPLNSPLSGQFDLNTVIPVFDKVELLKGGKAAFYGAGSMAGNIFLENTPEFRPRRHIKFSFTGGQTRLYQPSLTVHFSGKEYFFRFSYAYLHDENQYGIPGKDYPMHDARILTDNLNGDCAWKKKNLLFSMHFFRTFSDRYLPPVNTTKTDARLQMKSTNYALEAQFRSGRLQGQLTAGFQTGEYAYFIHRADHEPAGKGFSETFFFKTSFKQDISRHFSAFAEVEEKTVTGSTDNYPRKIQHNPVISAGGDYHRKAWTGKIMLRKNFNPQFCLNPVYTVMIRRNTGKRHAGLISFNTNQRLPAFNDLYWQPGGNPGLRPEKGSEWEVAHIFSGKFLYMKTTFFYKQTLDLIKWLPGPDGLWSPVNVDRVDARGLEWSWKIHTSFRRSTWQIRSEWVYQKVINRETGKQLIYTPAFNGFIHGEMHYGKFRAFYSFRYQDHYYIDPSHASIIYGHWLHSGGLGWRTACCEAEISIKNIFNRYYELMPGYPMPGREFRWKINIIINKNKHYEKTDF